MASVTAFRGRGAEAVLAVGVVAAWVGVVATRDAMAGAGAAGAAAFLAAWLVMMAAMMLPSAAPLVLVYRRAASGGAAVALVAGYLGVWLAIGAVAYTVARAVGEPTAAVAAAVLAAAGLYELTPLKSACLRRCRSPVDFLMQRWRRGRLAALRLGGEHGLYCVGCCWALMAVLVAAAAMSLAWVAVLALVVFVEKTLPHGQTTARILGLALVGLAVAIAIDPELVRILTGRR